MLPALWHFALLLLAAWRVGGFELKRAVLQSVARARRDGDASSIIAAVERLEQSVAGKKIDLKSLSGAWSLVYSTRASSANTPSSSSLTSALYKFFFKYLPFLAGSSGADEAASTSLAANIQEIDLNIGTIINTVTLNSKVLPFGLRLCIVVKGECSPSPARPDDTIDVVFTSFSLNDALVIPLPRPKGSLRTTFCDGDFRVGRGGQGGLFLVKRVPQS